MRRVKRIGEKAELSTTVRGSTVIGRVTVNKNIISAWEQLVKRDK